MYYVYCLQSIKNKSFYYGYAQDLKRRFKEHQNQDKNWKLIYYEGYDSKLDAQDRERKLKNYGQSRTHLKKRISHSIIK